MRVGFEGRRARARTTLKEGDTAYAALSWSEHDAAARLRRGVPPHGAHLGLLARVAEPRRVPGPSVADLPPAQRADAEGPRLRADGRAARRVDHVAARDARRRAQLGLPLHLDPRLHVHAVGPLHARLRLGGERLLLLRRGRRGEGREPPDHVRHRRREGARGAGAAAPVGLRGRQAGADRQRRVEPGPARPLGRGSRLGLPAHEVARRDAGAVLADARAAGAGGDRQLEGARTRHLGGARRAAALHLVEADVLGGARPRRAAGEAARRRRAGRRVADGRGRDQGATSARTRCARTACSRSTTTPTRSTHPTC